MLRRGPENSNCQSGSSARRLVSAAADLRVDFIGPDAPADERGAGDFFNRDRRCAFEEIGKLVAFLGTE